MSGIDIEIGVLAQHRLWAFIEAHKTEVGGFGFARFDRQNDRIVWDETFLVPQLVSHGEVDIQNEGLVYAIEKANNAGRLDADDFVWVSWHSHHTMKAFWSSTDEKCIKTYGGAGMKSLLSFVGCHDHEYRMRLDFFGVEHDRLVIPQLTMDEQDLWPQIDDPLNVDIYHEIKENVEVKKYAPATQQSFGGAKPVTTTKLEQVGEKTEQALKRADEIKRVMEQFECTYKEAIEIVEWYEDQDDDDFVITAHDEQAAYGFDAMAWNAA